MSWDWLSRRKAMIGRKLGSAGALLAAAGLLAAGAPAHAAIPIGEVGNTRSTATNIDNYYTLTSDANVFCSSASPDSCAFMLFPHADISGTNNSTSDVDWYSFTAGNNSYVIVDIDCGFNCGVS